MEGPSLIIIKEQLAFLKGRTITDANGVAKIDMQRLKNKRVKKILSFGKHFLIQLKDCTIRIHFLMFGSYRINERKDLKVRLSLVFDTDEVNFYSCAVTLLEEDPEDIYDWSIDVMSDAWDEKKVRRILKRNQAMNVGDALLDQEIFAGVGNIIKNEVLYRTGIHPENTINELPPRKLTELIREARNYSFDFYRWRKVYQLSKNYKIYKRKKCKLCGGATKLEYTGKIPRRTFYCDQCQVLYKIKSGHRNRHPDLST